MDGSFPRARLGRTRSRRAVACIGLVLLLVIAGCGANAPERPRYPGRADGWPGISMHSWPLPRRRLTPTTLPRPSRAIAAAVSQDPESAQAQFGLGNALVRQGKLAEAEAAYKAALAADPNMTAARANLGVVYYQLGQLAKAADEFTAALKASPNDAATTYLLGAVRLQENNLAEAERLLLKARDLDPNLPEAYYGLGALYKLKGRK